jgi:hypothetical protein
MSVTLATGRTDPTQVPPTGRRTRPVRVWAVIGLGQMALALYCIVGWAVSGQMTPTDPGPDEMSATATTAMWVLQIGGPIATVYCLWRFLIAPWRREGRLTGDGMLLIGCLGMAIPHDIMLTYTSYTYTYNSHYLNAGSWLSQVPGVQTPNAHNIPEPLILVLPAYGWAVFLAALLGCWFMRTVREHRPQTATAPLIALTFAAFFALDFVFEAVLIHLQAYTYTGTIHGLTVWEGTDHQLPVYEVLFWAAFWTSLTVLRFFRDDRGLTIVERGVGELNLSVRHETVLRQLALIGAGSAAITVFYNVPWSLAASHNNQFPQLPSYFQNSVCSPAPAQSTPALPSCPNRGAATYRSVSR